eukprot:14702009-Ditylum_brightwellii.AAC.1
MVLHELVGRGVEIPDHLVTPPLTNGPDFASIDTTKLKCHDATFLHQKCRNITGLKAKNQKGLLFPLGPALKYYPGCNKKKKAMKRRLSWHCRLILVWSKCVQRKMGSKNSTGLPCAEGGLPFAQNWSCH